MGLGLKIANEWYATAPDSGPSQELARLIERRIEEDGAASAEPDRVERLLAVLRRHGVVEFSGGGFAVKLALFVPQAVDVATPTGPIVQPPEHTKPDTAMHSPATHPQRITADDVFGGA